MLTMKMIVCIVVLGLVAATAVTSAAEPAISVSIAEPSRDVGERYIEYSGSNSHFHVVVTNLSNKPQRIWATSFSEGYLALSFEITNKNGKKWLAKRKDRNWMRNAPRWWILEPSEHLVIDVYFWDSTEWVGSNGPRNSYQQLS